MLNQIILVGRIASDLEINETKDNRKEVIIKLAVQRNFKNENGIYEIDFIPCTLLNEIAENTVKYCKQSDLIGVRGRLQSNENKSIVVIAEKVTFLSSKVSNETE